MSKKTKKENEEYIEEVKAFLENYMTFFKMFRSAFTGKEISREEEIKFLKLKSLLARKHQVILEMLDKIYVEALPITDLLSLTVTLNGIKRVSREHYNDIETRWHNTFIHLNETLGELRYLADNS